MAAQHALHGMTRELPESESAQPLSTSDTLAARLECSLRLGLPGDPGRFAQLWLR